MRLFCSISSLLNLASSGKLQNGEASSCWNYAGPTRTLASTPLPVSAHPQHPAAPMTLPAFLETHIIADGRKSPRYGSPTGPWQSSYSVWFMVNVPLREVRNWSAHTVVPGLSKAGETSLIPDWYFLWEVCLEQGLPEAVLKKSWLEPRRFVY